MQHSSFDTVLERNVVGLSLAAKTTFTAFLLKDVTPQTIGYLFHRIRDVNHFFPDVRHLLSYR